MEGRAIRICFLFLLYIFFSHRDSITVAGTTLIHFSLFSIFHLASHASSTHVFAPIRFSSRSLFSLLSPAPMTGSYQLVFLAPWWLGDTLFLFLLLHTRIRSTCYRSFSLPCVCSDIFPGYTPLISNNKKSLHGIIFPLHPALLSIPRCHSSYSVPFPSRLVTLNHLTRLAVPDPLPPAVSRFLMRGQISAES